MATPSKRPLSPHLQIWKWTPTMLMSILHRATGVGNSIGLLVLTWWLVSAATGPEAYNCFLKFAGSLVGQLMFLGWTFSVWLHLCSGIRHMISDTGAMLTIKSADRAIMIAIVSACILTILTWIQILGY